MDPNIGIEVENKQQGVSASADQNIDEMNPTDRSEHEKHIKLETDTPVKVI